MKNTLPTILVSMAIASCVAFTGCASGETQEPAQEPAEPQEAQTAETESKYDATIDDLATATDYEGKSAVVVTYSWTNNSEEATSAAVALSLKAFQNGVQLESGIVTDSIDNDGYMAEVKPGAGTTFQLAYLLDDQSDVTVEVSELISLDDVILAEQVFTLE